MIAEMRLSELQRRCGGELVGEDTAFSTLTTDSRAFKDGNAYLALVGERFDGHSFVDTLAPRAKAIIVERRVDVSAPQLVVEDSKVALGHIGAFCRDNFNAPVIAITGSSGKTTARNMTTAVLQMQGQVCATLANYNNEIGVPLTLLTLNDKHTAAVIELGARHVGDISYLGQFVRPTVSVLLNAGSAHIGEFGGYNNIVAAKGEIYSALDEGGVAIVNLDDKASAVWLSQLSDKNVLTYSLDLGHADVRATDITLGPDYSDFRLHASSGIAKVRLSALGMHNVSNALAAAATGLALGLSVEEIAVGLSKYQGEAGRLTKLALSDKLTVIDDSYNANLASMKAAVDVLCLERGYTVAIIGEMGELGAHAEQMHEELAAYISESAVDECWLIGTYAQAMQETIGTKARCFETKQYIASGLLACDKTCTVLLKASRFVALEEVIGMYQRGRS